MAPDRINIRFLELVSAATWEKPLNTAMFTGLGEEEWISVLQLCADHGVVAFVAEKILSLPDCALPPQKIIIPLLLQIEETKGNNLKLIALLKNLLDSLAAINIFPILLKGLSNAICYPNPFLRAVGDIDLLLPNIVDYNNANEWAKNKGYQFNRKNIHHQGYYIEGLQIEHHKYITYFGRKKYDKIINTLLEETIINNKQQKIQISGVEVQTLSTELNALYIFIHLFNHFIHSGVGIRQVCDWLLFLNKNKNTIDKELFISMATSLGLMLPMKIFAGAAIKHLCAPPQIFPFKVDVSGKLSDTVMLDIISAGNFGNRRLRKYNKFASWHRYRIAMLRSFKFFKISPAHIGFVPFTKLFMKIELLSSKTGN